MGHFKVMILAAMGLSALYLMHLLAQDYMKIRKPAAKLAKFLLSKRDLDSVDKFEIDWERILKNDPFKCARLLICQIVAGIEKDNEDVIIINHLIEYAIQIGAPKEILLAYTHGRTFMKTSDFCYKHYPLCPYSGHTMLKLLKIYSWLNINNF